MVKPLSKLKIYGPTSCASKSITTWPPNVMDDVILPEGGELSSISLRGIAAGKHLPKKQPCAVCKRAPSSRRARQIAGAQLEDLIKQYIRILRVIPPTLYWAIRNFFDEDSFRGKFTVAVPFLVGRPRAVASPFFGLC